MADRTSESERGLITGGRAGLLAAALLSLELLAGMQAYLLNTIIPIVGTDLDATDFYGVIIGTAQVAMFLTMPLGPWLLARFRVDGLLLSLTWLTIAGAVTSALAPTVAVFLIGRAAAGLGAGALATVSLAAIVSVLPASWRRAVLAGYNVMWVITSLIGPLYAGWVASALSWRWALVLYLPLLLIARVVAARQLRNAMQKGDPAERLTVGAAILLASGVALLAIVGLQSIPAWLAIAAGAGGVGMALVAARNLLPRGTFRIRPGRPAALGSMGLLTGAYFGAQAIISILVYDLLDGSTGQVAVVLASSGLGWALAGIAASRWPAQGARAYVLRASIGAILIALGCGILILGVLWLGPGSGIPLALTGWALAGIGIGMSYLDTLNHIVEVPPERDGVSVSRAATAAILVEAIATAVMATVASAVVGRAITVGEGDGVAAVVLGVMAITALSALWSVRRVGGSDPV